MAETPSTMLPLGTQLPAVRLTDAVTGQAFDVTKAARHQKGVLVAFICNHCPFVKHILEKLVEVAHTALKQGFVVVAINSNDEKTFPEDGPAAMRQLAQEKGWRFPYLFDESQAVAKAFRAACTPDLYLFDEKLQLAYRGQFDDSRPSNGKPVTGASLWAAIQAVAEKRVPSADQKPSVGCNIKWKPDNQPT